jgi:hypothetical protein
MSSLDVYYNGSDIEALLLQFPITPSYAPGHDFTSARLRPEHRRLELNFAYPEMVFSPDALEDQFADPQDREAKLISSRVAQPASLCVGVLSHGSLHLSPVRDILQMRPSLDEWVEERYDDSDDDEADYFGGAVRAAKKEERRIELQQVHMARRDPEKTLQSRNTSFLSVQTKEEGEDWVDLILHKASTQEAQGAVQRLRSYKVVKNE